jgi:hypothetical protein
MAALFAIKATGFMIGGALAVGEIWRRLPALRAGDRPARRAALAVAAGVALGTALVMVANVITTGGVGFGYNHQAVGTAPFWFSHLPQTAPEHLRTVLLLPPLLFLGAVPFWRAREPAPLLVILGFGGLMCVYFFVDSGTNWVETWVLAPRLLLPVVVFLLIGYAHLLAGLARRLTGRRWIVDGGLIIAAGAMALAVSWRHHRWQVPMGRALEAAQGLATQIGASQLDVLPQAVKAGVLFPGDVRMIEPRDANGPVVLCSDHSASYRLGVRDGRYACSLPGYRSAFQEGGFEVLARDDAQR